MDYSTDYTKVEKDEDPLGFDKYWEGMSPSVEFQDRHAATERLWFTTPDDKKQAILDWIQSHGAYPGRNPYFFILDFKMKRKQPKDLNKTNKGGKMLESGKAEIAFYGTSWGVYSQEDIKAFRLLTKKEYDKQQEQLKQQGHD